MVLTKDAMTLKPQNSRASGQGPAAIAAPLRRCQSPGTRDAGWSAAPIQKLKQRLQEAPIRGSTFEKGTDMRLLFRYNEPTRMDYLVHLSLGLAAVAAVVCSLGATFDFCARLDQIAEWFQASSAVVAVPGEGERISFTNAAGVGVPVLDAGQATQTNFPAPAADQ